jgi:hypothetical protein
MRTIQVEAAVSSEQLLKAVAQMPPDELAEFVARVVVLRSRRDVPSLSEGEEKLLMRINDAIPEDLQRRYGELIAKREAAVLSEEELAELLRLTDEVEVCESDRVAALADLARLWETSVREIMRSMGIKQPSHG